MDKLQADLWNGDLHLRLRGLHLRGLRLVDDDLHLRLVDDNGDVRLRGLHLKKNICALLEMKASEILGGPPFFLLFLLIFDIVTPVSRTRESEGGAESVYFQNGT